jgi:hypothetical protein
MRGLAKIVASDNSAAFLPTTGHGRPVDLPGWGAGTIGGIMSIVNHLMGVIGSRGAGHP